MIEATPEPTARMFLRALGAGARTAYRLALAAQEAYQSAMLGF